MRRLIRGAGLLNKQPLYYIYKIPFSLGLLAASIALLFFIGNFWLQMANAVFMAFALTQVALIGHDAGHRQIFRGGAVYDVASVAFTFVLGLSQTWWIEKHNAHHSNPNDIDLDPDATIPVLAFSEEQALEKEGVLKAITRYQAFLFFPLLLLEGIGLRYAALQYLARERPKQALIEVSVIAAHIAGYATLIFLVLDVWQAVAFVAVHQALFGLYTGSIFAPNHKGMLLTDKNSNLGILRQQVLTSRNVKAHPLTDFWYGGLNYQIEHHLFPNMPRNNLRKAQVIVKQFCAEHSISYHETSVVQSYREIVGFLHEMSAPLRTKAKPPASSEPSTP